MRRAEQSAAAKRDRRPRRSLVVAVVVVAALATMAAVLAPRRGDDAGPVAAGPHADATIAGTPVTVGTDVCGAGWTGGAAGPRTFAFWNNSIEVLEVYIEDVTTHQILMDAENIGSGATRAFSVDLAPGTYDFYCMPSESDPVTGARWTVTGSAAGAATRGLVPITVRDLIPVLGKYDAWIRTRLPTLQTRTRRLADDVRRGDRAAAERDWLAAHEEYQTLGAAYGAFGKDGEAIDETPLGESPAQVAKDPHVTGFHKVEAQLWGGTPLAQIQAPADTLLAAVVRLRADMANPVQSTSIIGLRAHEIIEDAISFSLTGEDDFGSHSDLATIEANLTGSVEALRQLRPLLRSRDHDLASTDAWIARSQRLVRGFHHAGGWAPLRSLSRLQRERLGSYLDQTAELLSEVAVIADPRRSN